MLYLVSFLVLQSSRVELSFGPCLVFVCYAVFSVLSSFAIISWEAVFWPVFSLCFVVLYLVSFLVLQSSRVELSSGLCSVFVLLYCI